MVKPPFYPTPPPKGASRLDRLLFLRKNYLYSAALLLPVLVVGLVLSEKVIIVICVAGWVLQGIGAATLELQIRAERRKTTG